MFARLRPTFLTALSISILCVVAATSLRIALGYLIGTNLLFVLYYPAVLLAALAGGLFSGTLAIALTIVTVWWAFSPPYFGFGIPTKNDIANYSVFTASAFLIVWLVQLHRKLIFTYEAQQRELSRAIEQTETVLHDRAMAQADLNRANALFQAVINMTPDLVFVKDLESRALLRNPAARFGRQWDEIKDREESEWHPHSDEVKQVIANDRKVIESGTSMQFVEQFTTPQGRRVLLSTKSPLFDERGKITGTIGVSTDITERENRAKHIEFIMRELSHRSKNLLAVIQAVARQSIRQSASLEDFESQFNERLASLARLHDLLVQEEWRGASLRAIAQTQVGPFAGSRVRVEGPELLIKPDAAQVISMVFHELATNASKYGALSNGDGVVTIAFGYIGDQQQRLFIRWQETGGPAVMAPLRKGFGSVVLERMALQIPEASASLKFLAPGVIWHLEAPASSLLEASPPSSQADTLLSLPSTL